MDLKKIRNIAAICFTILYCLCTNAYAEESLSENIILQKEITWEWVDISEVKTSESDIMVLSNASIGKRISAHSIGKVSPLISLQANNKIIFNCTYAPSSASVDFGILSPSGKFYPINAQDGKINQSLQISYSGNYYIAIRNNSDQSVTVTGTVEY